MGCGTVVAAAATDAVALCSWHLHRLALLHRVLGTCFGRR